MLRDLRIQNYRCFEDFYIDSLAPVNLIVGKNSIGKTCFLEAIHLLTRPGYNSLFSILNSRNSKYNKIGFEQSENSERIALKYSLREIFFNRDSSRKIYIGFGSEEDQEYEILRIETNEKRRKNIRISKNSRSRCRTYKLYNSSSFSRSNISQKKRERHSTFIRKYGRRYD
ncbi:MAG: AAA family ATPase [Spirulina sp.]